MRTSPLVSILAVAATLAGCRGCGQPAAPTRCAPGAKASLEVRDGTGALVLALKEAPEVAGQRDLCGPDGQVLAAVALSEGRVRLLDAAGGLLLTLAPESPADAEGRTPAALRLRLHAEGKDTRVLDPIGVPFGSVLEEAEGATVFDKASRPIATVEPHDGGMALKGRDGVLAYIKGAPSARAAAAFALPELKRQEQVALSVFWSR